MGTTCSVNTPKPARARSKKSSSAPGAPKPLEQSVTSNISLGPNDPQPLGEQQQTAPLAIDAEQSKQTTALVTCCRLVSGATLDSCIIPSAFRAPRPAQLPAADDGTYAVPAESNPFLPPPAAAAGAAAAGQFDSAPIVAAPILLRIDGLGPSDDVPTDHYDEHMRLRPLDPNQYVLFHIPHATYSTRSPQLLACNKKTSDLKFRPLSMEHSFAAMLAQMRSEGHS